jgi:hypothetical protein
MSGTATGYLMENSVERLKGPTPSSLSQPWAASLSPDLGQTAGALAFFSRCSIGNLLSQELYSCCEALSLWLEHNKVFPACLA